MKKRLIASALAAASLSSNTFASEPLIALIERVEALPTIYGSLEFAHISTDNSDGVAFEDIGTAIGDDGNEFADIDSFIGIKHEHDITDGLTGFFKAEFLFDGDNSSTSNGIDELQGAYIGLSGDFGTAKVGTLGEDETVYDWVDLIDTYEAVGIEGEIAAIEEGDNFQYESPELLDGVTLGFTLPFDSDSNFGGAFAAQYESDFITAVAAYALGREEFGVDVGDTFALAASVNFDELTLIAQYESADEATTNNVVTTAEQTLWGVKGVYVTGKNTLSIGYLSRDFDDVQELTAFDIQALHNLSENLYVYLEYLSADLEPEVGSDSDGDSLAVGATYLF